VDLLFGMMTGVGLAAIAGLLLACYVALSRDPDERRQERHGEASAQELSLESPRGRPRRGTA